MAGIQTAMTAPTSTTILKNDISRNKKRAMRIDMRSYPQITKNDRRGMKARGTLTDKVLIRNKSDRQKKA